MRPLPALLALFPLVAGPASAQWSQQALSAPRAFPASARAGDLVLVAGGVNGTTPSAVVDVYDSSQDQWSTAVPLTVPRTLLAATTVGPYVLFAGGSDSASTDSAVVDVYDSSLGSPSDPSAWSVAHLSLARFALAGTTVGSKAIFAGGAIGGFNSPSVLVSDRVDVYDASVGPPSDPLAWSWTTLSEARAGLAAATAGDVALFAGGTDGVVVSATVDVYDDSTGLWHVDAHGLSEARGFRSPDSAATAVGSRAFFAGGEVGSGIMSDAVDIYDAQSGTWSLAHLSKPRGALAATALGNTVLFAGGLEAGFGPSRRVDLLDAGTGQWTAVDALSQARGGLCARSVGGKALFAGGSSGFGSPHTVVDVYEPVGLNYCVATTNSSGCAASISATGSTSLAANDLVLSSTCVPDGVFVFFHGSAQVQIPFGDGQLCVGGALVRIQPVGIATGGLAQVTVDLPAAGITSPGPRNFQCWFRDVAAGGAGFNSSDAMAITFLP